MKTGRRFALILICFLVLICVSGCSSGSKKASSFQMAFCAAHVDERAVTSFGTSMTSRMPELTIDGKAPQFLSMMMGGQARSEALPGLGASDPMLIMGGIVRISSMVAAGELDVMVADMENAARDARGSIFMPLKDIFTEAELADISLTRELLSFELVDTASEIPAPTGEMTPLCGIEVSGNDQIRAIFGNQKVGVFIIANTKNPDLAKAVMISLVK